MHAESLFEKASLPFHRPTDYFAEMVKTDAHMAQIRQSLLDEQAGMKASEDARKLRDAKKFGKKVQHERLRERERDKKAIGEKLDSLKKSEPATFPPPFFGDIISVHPRNLLTDSFASVPPHPRAKGRLFVRQRRLRSRARGRPRLWCLLQRQQEAQAERVGTARSGQARTLARFARQEVRVRRRQGRRSAREAEQRSRGWREGQWGIRWWWSWRRAWWTWWWTRWRSGRRSKGRSSKTTGQVAKALIAVTNSIVNRLLGALGHFLVCFGVPSSFLLPLL